MNVSVSVSTAVAKRRPAISAPSRHVGAPRAMSVAIYMHDLRGGGVERQSLIIAEEFRRHGVDVTLVLHRLQGELADQVPPGLRIVNLGSSRTLMDVPRLARFLRSEKPDILVSNVDLNNVAALLAKAEGDPAGEQLRAAIGRIRVGATTDTAGTIRRHRT